MASLPDQLVRTRRFTLGAPSLFTVVRAGAAVLFLRSRAGDDPVSCLWLLDLASGAERLLATGVGAYATDATGELAAFAADRALWTVDVGSGELREVSTAGPVVDPRPDPAGRRIAYVSDGALRVTGADGDHALATPDGPEVTYGAGGYWWSPGGDRLLVARTDSAAVPLWHLPDPATPGAAPRTVRYPAAGAANPLVSLWIAGLDGERTAALIEALIDRGQFEYLVRAGWDELGPFAAVQSRDQRAVRLLALDPVTGTARPLAEQHDDCWVQVLPGLPARTATGAVVAHADRAGTRRLTVAGVAVTPPGLQLRAVLGCSPDILFTASAEPTETHLWSYRPGDGLRRLTAGPGVHDGVRGHGTLVRIDASRPGGRVTVRRPGRPDRPIASTVEEPVLTAYATSLVLGPRELRARLFRPSWHRPGGGRLPVLVDPYGGASRQRVTAAFDWRDLVSQWFAEQGFAVLVTDGSGTPGRGPQWEREVHGDLFGPVLADQVDALREAARSHPELDLGRVGIRGWSFGGSLAALAVLRRPDVFHAAVAGAGVTDPLLYSAAGRERFLGHPDDFPARYAASSLVRAAPELTRPLLLVHGLADDNVHPAHTLRFSRALVAAGRPHEVLLLPGAGHQAIGMPAAANLLQHQLGFLGRHLLTGGGPSTLSGPRGL